MTTHPLDTKLDERLTVMKIMVDYLELEQTEFELSWEGSEVDPAYKERRRKILRDYQNKFIEMKLWRRKITADSIG